MAVQGQGAEGIVQILQGLAAYRATGAELLCPYFLALLAEAYGSIGQGAEGLSVLEEALPIVDQKGVRFYEAELHRLRGELLLQHAVAQPGEAEAGFQQKYLDMLRAGGTKRHKELLAPFGLDAGDPAFWRKGLGVIESFIDELERL